MIDIGLIQSSFIGPPFYLDGHNLTRLLDYKSRISFSLSLLVQGMARTYNGVNLNKVISTNFEFFMMNHDDSFKTFIQVSLSTSPCL